MTDEDHPDGVMDFEIGNEDEDQRWVVLYDEDYENVMLDGDDRVALLVNYDQAGELVRLSTMALAALGTAESGDEVLRSLADSLEEEIGK